jgi:hypothetical protein
VRREGRGGGDDAGPAFSYGEDFLGRRAEIERLRQEAIRRLEGVSPKPRGPRPGWLARRLWGI